MTERHFFLDSGYLVRIRSYGTRREWAVYQDGLPHGPWFGQGTTHGSLKDAKRAAHAALDRTLSAAENPIDTTTRNVLLGVVAASFGVALYYAVKAPAVAPGSTTSTTTSSPGPIAIHLTSADSGYPLDANIGDGITIALTPPDATSHWLATITPLGTGVVTIIGVSAEAAVFQATQAGSALITLQLFGLADGQPVPGSVTLTYPITVT